MSGAELAIHTVETVTGAKPRATPPLCEAQCETRSGEYWAGWALAQYQWYAAIRFAVILRFLPFDDIVRMYPAMHEADITKFFMTANDIRSREWPQTNLKRIRKAVGISQSHLAKEAGVSLRSIQMYEQRNKDVNKAQAMTLAKIALTLDCNIMDILEINGD
jgi:DNA-binding transcriptional regulator YiaG